MINNFYLCQKLKRLITDKGIDLNLIWRSQRGLGQSDALKKLLLGQIPLVDQCNLRKCSPEL